MKKLIPNFSPISTPLLRNNLFLLFDSKIF